MPTSGWIEMETDYRSDASSDKSMDTLAEYEGLYYVWCQASFKIPQTGENIAIITAVVAIIIISVIGYNVSKKYRDIK